MRSLFGVVLVLAGFILIYVFGSLGISAARAADPPLAGTVFSLPLQTLGANYPKGVICLACGLGALAWGLFLLMRGRTAAPPPTPWTKEVGRLSHGAAKAGGDAVRTGSYARGFCALSLGASVAWGIAALGASAGGREAVIGGFILVAALAMLEAILLGALSFFEANKPVLILVAGWALFLVAAGVGVAAFTLSG